MKKILISLSIMLLLVIPVHSAQAISLGGIFGCGAAEAGGAVKTAVTTAVTSTVGIASAVQVNDASANLKLETQNIKDCVLDGLVVAIRQGIITATTQSIVNWINGGFEGGPSFVTDLNRYLGEIADETSLEFIQGTELGFLCSPFSLDVRLALTVNRQPFQERIRCSLDDVVGNSERFLSGAFSEGGWPGWFRVATNIQNNPYGAYLVSSGQLEARIASRQGEQLSLLNFGQGFLSPRQCVEYEKDPITGEPGECLRYEITTPGSIVNDTLSNHLGSGLKQLELADEIDEIINALLAQLSQQVITGAQGLRGLSQRSGGQGSFLERLVEESNVNARTAVGNVIGNDLDRSIDFQETYRATLNETLDELDNFETTLTLFAQCDTPISTEGEATLKGIGMEGVVATDLIAIIKQIIETNRSRYLALLENSEDSLNVLIELRTDTLRAQTLQEFESTVEIYDSFIQQGIHGTNTDILSVQADRANLQNMMGIINASLDSCISAPQ
ncbi:hypothetical protein COU15_02830 [Candidatus Kaiserbacteria bacterium CG10_big_fil_rev_8_21_14_0_10_45_20]|uniref:Uncharacterized protein n=1 Tax=Candidatus Kaiserbacteria bacterium CG10_big_fil_rev_8_21_14_0_10_45_20 TaxID=1974607 RepID=A0A2H0UF86_9BACT|nr:MAG: hypothetical protein COU15_02830 [Candidatus Kaiserbacteria bacterium CG10_big_fil_rev_8_21_14_0_10_45_20]